MKKGVQTAIISPDLPPRQRILAAARDLFSQHGIRAIGVEVIAETALTNKMTLYRHFGSKDELVAAYLQSLADDGDARWSELTQAAHGDPQTQLDAWLAHVSEVVSDCGTRGCPIANAAVELRDTDHPARRIIEDYKNRKRERLIAMFRDVGYADPESLADEVFLLFEGARISLQCCAMPGPASRLVVMLRSLLARHPRMV